MKNRCLLIFFVFWCSILLSGCEVLLEFGGGGEAGADLSLGTAERGVLADAAEGLTASQLDELAGEGITAEDVAVFRNSTVEIRSGRLVTAEEVAFNEELEKIKIRRAAGENPKLYVDGYSKPFGEVNPDDGTVNIYSLNKTFSIHDNIFSVEGENVRVLYDLHGSGGKVARVVHKGDLVVKLSEDGRWYRVNILQNGTQLSGYIASRFLAPVVLATALIDSAKTSADAIKNEVKVRWDYYWKSMKSIEMTAQDAMAILYTDFGKKEYQRKVSFSTNDWDKGIDDFLQMQYDNIPILNDKKFSSDSLEIIGFTRANELLQLVRVFNQPAYIKNPMDWGPDNIGEWTQVRTLDGAYGWIFTKPYPQTYANGIAVKRAPEATPAANPPQSGNNDTADHGSTPDNNLKYICIIGLVILVLIVVAVKSSLKG
ncbi:MAG TPA: hypothetical protein VFE53_08265 [Mucilaginibacter sp.]|jgi:hypothetical protein|nr:hypothetical protein [Mucilaginibacter sp.]